LAAAAALFLGFSAPASAAADDDLVPYTTVGHWQIMSSDNECRAHSYYQNGTTLGFYVDVSGHVSIGIGNPKWNIPEGEYAVSAQVDQTKPGHMTARGNRTWIVFGIVGSEGDMNLLSYGRTLYVTLGTQVYQYELIRSEAMLKALVQCAATRMAAANPFSGDLVSFPGRRVCRGDVRASHDEGGHGCLTPCP
jgi:hypothetical protein